MSADLWAAFGNDEQQAWTEVDSANSNPATSKDKAVKATPPYEASGGHWDSSSTVTAQSQNPLWDLAKGGDHVLFDADTADDDEFGAFENVENFDSTATKPDRRPLGSTLSMEVKRESKPTLIDYMDSNDNWGTPSALGNTMNLDKLVSSTTNSAEIRIEDPLVADFEEEEEEGWGGFAVTGNDTLENALNQGQKHHSTPPVDPPASRPSEADEDWDTFEDGNTSSISCISNQKQDNSHDRDWQTKMLQPSQIQERPTNVPPPAVLLGILPNVYAQLSTILIRQELSEADIVDKILTMFRVSSKIIASRSLRWKRDTILMQNMKMGQAGKAGGMKLASVNKGERAKEERETAEAVEAWSRKAHQFNNLLAKAKAKHQSLRLSVSMPVKTVQGINLTSASHVCPICGLKRTERIPGADSEIEDVFGEFWVENWGHTDCSKFWYEYKDLLNQR